MLQFALQGFMVTFWMSGGYPLSLHPHPKCTASAPKHNLGDQRTPWNMINHFNFLFLFLIIGCPMNLCLSFKAAAAQNVTTLVDLRKLYPFQT